MNMSAYLAERQLFSRSETGKFFSSQVSATMKKKTFAGFARQVTMTEKAANVEHD